MEKLRKIILVEDDEDDREFFSMALTSLKLNAEMLQYKDGREFLNKFEEKDFALPDFVFLDLNLQFINGFTILEAINKLKHIPPTKVIMITTSNSDQDINQSIELGASGYIVKPSSIDGLANSVKGVIDHFFDDKINSFCYLEE